MRTTSTLSVLFWIHSNRVDKNNLSQLYARLRVNRKRATISVNQKVDVDLFETPKSKRNEGFCEVQNHKKRHQMNNGILIWRT